MKTTTSIRLKDLMSFRNLKQSDIIKLAEPYCIKYNVKMNKSDLSQYVSGKVVPAQDKIAILSLALNVSETWLMGYDVPESKTYDNVILTSLCSQNNMCIDDLCDLLKIDISKTTDLNVNGLNEISETISKISAFFNVTPEYFRRNIDNYYCYDCGFSKYTNDNEEIAAHNEMHSLWQQAVKKFGFCWEYTYRENVKADARNNIADNPQMPVQKYIDLQILIFKSLFSRSVEASKYDLEHISFDKFCAALLNQKQFKDKIREDVYNEMIKKYGTNDLVPNGTYYTEDRSYYFQHEISPTTHTKRTRKNKNEKLKEDEQKLIDSYRSLNKEGQEKLLDYGDDLVQSGKYKKSDTDKLEA